MLVLSRKEGEKIFIGDNVVVTVAEVRGNRVRLVFDAPMSVRIAMTTLEPTDGPAPAQQPAGRKA
jgi:carbon storage regulator